ncbi:hypothetical protein [Zobellella maritima]|uniref:hypothetical protein n=1 Tax=Zobellella maritima TaxID=2059725 RepID=UPI000E308241|nr:hypothetical protein [Zobellella maritima]
MRITLLPAIALLAVGAVQAAELPSNRDPAHVTLQSDNDGIDRLEKRLSDLREAQIRIVPQPAIGI